jgi:hypothetical protein
MSFEIRQGKVPRLGNDALRREINRAVYLKKPSDFETQEMVDGDARLITTEAVGEDCRCQMKECA